MQTIIMTVGTSLRTNRDENLSPEAKRPWAGKKASNDERMIDDCEGAIAWMSKTDPELISAETNTFWRLDLKDNDEIVLLHSATTSGLECAELLREFLKTSFGQKDVRLREIPGIDYELDKSKSALEKMAELLKKLVEEAKGDVTLAATGGFKAQTMIVALVGNACGVPICYIHEDYKGLVYLPYFSDSGQTQNRVRRANLPESSKRRSEVINVQDDSQGHHRPKVWKRVAKMLEEIPWVEYVRFDEQAFNAPKNGVKAATRGTPDQRHVFWIHLFESQEKRIAVSVETTGYTPEHMEQASVELRERLGRLL
jgi:putative CRISPR-associated protein (TIGR02619 family)